jgi:hypothetical protein
LEERAGVVWDNHCSVEMPRENDDETEYVKKQY